MDGRAWTLAPLLAGALAMTMAAPVARAEGTAQAEAVRLVERFGNEPMIAEVQRRALEHVGLDGALDGWATRSRLRHLLPKVQGKLEWHLRRDETSRYREDFERDGPWLRREEALNELNDDRQDRQVWGLSVTLEPGGLIYDEDELRADRAARQRAEAREELLVRVTSLYFERRLQQVEQLLVAPGDLRRALELELEIQRDTALLDAMTGGWFGREVAR